MARREREILSNKIPKDFSRRVLLRLLPTPSDIANMDEDQLVETVKVKQELEHLISTDPLRFFTPNRGAQDSFLRCWDVGRDQISILLFVAGNKAGKTTAGAILMLERLLGKALWDRESRSDIEWPTPARGAVFAEDFESHEEVIVPTLKSWAPTGSITQIRRNNAGSITQLIFKNGSILHCKTFSQGSDSAEGKDWDMVWCDEPPPLTLYTSVLRGLVSTNGKMFVTATLLKEVWLYDERTKPFVEAFQSTIHENDWLSEQGKRSFLESLPEEERLTREMGQPMNLSGLIYKRFTDSPPFVVPRFEVPDNCPIIMGVDPHERRPVYIEWAFISPANEVVWFEWARIQGADLDSMFDQIRIKEGEMPTAPIFCVMDPNRGRAKQIGGISWEEVFIERGYDVLLGIDDLHIGHPKMYSLLTPDSVTGRPKMFWMDSCRGKGGPVYQMLRYGWEDWPNRMRFSKDPKEKPKDAYKDFPDIHRYVAMADLKYEDLVHGYGTVDILSPEWSGYGRVH